ncbi:MAG: glycosyltransferase family 2 protein, partial [Pseudomonadota bacterium]
FAVIYRFFLLIISLNSKTPKTKPLSPDQLPTVTILVPLYDEAKSVSRLLRSLRALDYPQEKLDIKLLLEGDDRNTIEEVRRHKLDDHFDVLLIPPCPPRTKPKACNFGLRLARGDLIVIYDAEDRPEPDQIQKAASAFHKADDDLACVQAKLNYYNKHENWLTRLFTLEYSLWFDWLLPALQELRAPIPLGGTSNFFRTDKLIEIGGWDPYNVTEDADIGIRISKLGYRVEIIDSTTFEEANCRLGNWVRQRSRWMKGYLQTWLVHMRKPHEIIRSSGWGGFLSLQLFVAGNIFSAIINPVLWTTTLIWLFTRTDAIAAAFPGPLLDLNMIALVAGNSFFVALSVIAPLRRGWFGLAAYGLTAPIYWLLTSIAAYKALWQIVLRPHYWEKTEHAISKSFDRE